MIKRHPKGHQQEGDSFPPDTTELGACILTRSWFLWFPLFEFCSRDLTTNPLSWIVEAQSLLSLSLFPPHLLEALTTWESDSSLIILNDSKKWYCNLIHKYKLLDLSEVPKHSFQDNCPYSRSLAMQLFNGGP